MQRERERERERERGGLGGCQLNDSCPRRISGKPLELGVSLEGRGQCSGAQNQLGQLTRGIAATVPS